MVGRPRSYHVTLDKEEVTIIKALKKRMPNETLKDRCSIILAANETDKHHILTYDEIAKAVAVSHPTVISTLKSFTEGGLAETLTIHRNPKSDIGNLKFDGEDETRIIARACSPAPSGRCRWTLKLLSSSMTLILEKSISPSTIYRKLTRNELRPHLTDYWCIPPKDNAEFAYKMEDIISLYQQPFDPTRLLICMDEKPYQLLDESRNPLPMRPGDIKKVDSEYIRDGTVSIFCFILPHTGTIYVSVEETRTAVDWAHKLKWIKDEKYPDAEKIILVCDNLNTHTPVSLYKTFKPAEAHRLASAFEVHYTPPHGSWLDIAEQGINIFSRQCLGRRIGEIENLRNELDAWQRDYNSDPTPIDWQFTVDEARIKLKSIYPNNEKYQADRNEKAAQKSHNRKASQTSKNQDGIDRLINVYENRNSDNI